MIFSQNTDRYQYVNSILFSFHVIGLIKVAMYTRLMSHTITLYRMLPLEHFLGVQVKEIQVTEFVLKHH